MQKFVIYSPIQNFIIKKYKNGYLIGLIGANTTVRIFIAFSSIIDKDGFLIIFKQNFKFLLSKLYGVNIYNNLNYLKYVMQLIKHLITLKMTMILQKFKNKLWFKGRSFHIKAYPKLFINRGYVKIFKFVLPLIFNVTLGQKLRYLRIYTNNLELLYQYIYLVRERYKPNSYTGKGIRIKNLLLRKKSGKRKIY